MVWLDVVCFDFFGGSFFLVYIIVFFFSKDFGF